LTPGYQIVELSRVGESYNVAPTNVMPIVRPAGNGRELLMARPGQGFALQGNSALLRRDLDGPVKFRLGFVALTD
jgi:hypothetical protein